MIYFVTVNYYSTALIANLLKSIQPPATIPYKFIIVNNSPDDRSIYGLDRDYTLILDAGGNLGFGAGCNLGISCVFEQDPHAIVWLINPDTQLQEDSLDKVPAFFEAHPELSILGTIVYEPSGKVWFAGGKFIPQSCAIQDKNLLADNPDVPYVPCDWVSGCSLLINLTRFQECPQFDPAYFLYYEDFDFCRRYANKGHLIAVTSHLAVVHHPSSINDKNIYNKFKHSTYSYFLTIQRYSNKFVLFLRFIRLVLHAIILLFVKRAVGMGKLEGVWLYLRRSLCRGGVPPRFL